MERSLCLACCRGCPMHPDVLFVAQTAKITEIADSTDEKPLSTSQSAARWHICVNEFWIFALTGPRHLPEPQPVRLAVAVFSSLDVPQAMTQHRRTAFESESLLDSPERLQTNLQDLVVHVAWWHGILFHRNLKGDPHVSAQRCTICRYGWSPVGTPQDLCCFESCSPSQTCQAQRVHVNWSKVSSHETSGPVPCWASASHHQSWQTCPRWIGSFAHSKRGLWLQIDKVQSAAHPDMPSAKGLANPN